MLTPLLLAFALAAPAAAAPVTTVHVPYVRDPVDKSYRDMIKGMDRFARDRAYAPDAALRFRLLPRLPDASMDGIALRVAGDTVTVPVTLAEDNSFTLERHDQALREDAAVVANRKSTSMTWRASVQTPGLPPGTRRLGDLRLECRVGMDANLISNTSPLFAWLTRALSNTEETCSSSDGNYLFFTGRPLFSVTLRHGERSAVLPFKLLYAGGNETPSSLPYCDCQVLLDRSYYAPLWDRSWPDDTLLEFTYMDAAPSASVAAPAGIAQAVVPGVTTRAELAAAMAPAKTIAFDSGYQAWRYQWPAGAAQLTEFVVLIGPDGVVRQSRMHNFPLKK